MAIRSIVHGEETVLFRDFGPQKSLVSAVGNLAGRLGSLGKSEGQSCFSIPPEPSGVKDPPAWGAATELGRAGAAVDCEHALPRRCPKFALPGERFAPSWRP